MPKIGVDILEVWRIGVLRAMEFPSSQTGGPLSCTMYGEVGVDILEVLCLLAYTALFELLPKIFAQWHCVSGTRDVQIQWSQVPRVWMFCFELTMYILYSLSKTHPWDYASLKH